MLFVLAGDLLSPSLLSKYYGGRQMVEALNAAKLDYATFGNHEFELPRDTLVARIAESNFQWISSNCTQADGSPFPKVLPLGHRPGVGAPGRDVRAHPAGRLPQLRALRRPRQRGPRGHPDAWASSRPT